MLENCFRKIFEGSLVILASQEVVRYLSTVYWSKIRNKMQNWKEILSSKRNTPCKLFWPTMEFVSNSRTENILLQVELNKPLLNLSLMACLCVTSKVLAVTRGNTGINECNCLKPFFKSGCLIYYITWNYVIISW